MDVGLHEFVTSTTYSGESSCSHHGRFNRGNRNFVKVWVDTGLGLGPVMKKNNSWSRRESNHNISFAYLLA